MHTGKCEAYARVYPSQTHHADGCKECSHGTEKIDSETAWRSIADAVYSAGYQSQGWFISYWFYSTCDTRYGGQLGHAKPDLGTGVHSPAHQQLWDPQTRSTLSKTLKPRSEFRGAAPQQSYLETRLLPRVLCMQEQFCAFMKAVSSKRHAGG